MQVNPIRKLSSRVREYVGLSVPRLAMMMSTMEMRMTRAPNQNRSLLLYGAKPASKRALSRVEFTHC